MRSRTISTVFAGTAIVVAMLASASVSAQGNKNPNVYLIKRAWVPCLLDNSTKYLSQDGLILYIRPEICPNVDFRGTAQDIGVHDNPDSQTFVVPKRKGRCFFDRLQQAARGGAAADLNIDITDC